MKTLYKTQIALESTLVRTPSIVDDFYVETISKETKTKPKPTVRYIDPIYMLFNQQRLARMGKDNVQQWLDSLRNAGYSEVDELRSKCTDEQLVTMIKSRYLQSPSEILNWCRYVNEHVEEFNAEVKKSLEIEQTQQTAQAQVNTTTNTE